MVSKDYQILITFIKIFTKPPPPISKWILDAQDSIATRLTLVVTIIPKH
jgi:hypothetical protein